MILTDLPVENLYTILLYTSYDTLWEVAKVNRLMNLILNEPSFWKSKAQLDYKVSSTTFTQIAYPDPRKRYSLIHLCRDFRKVLYSFLLEIFDIGMYSRGWAGPNTPYPIKNGDVAMVGDGTKYYDRINILLVSIYYKLTLSPPNIKRWLQFHPLLKYRKVTLAGYGYTYLDVNSGGYCHTNRDFIDFFNHTQSPSVPYGCMRCESYILISTACYYLQEMYDVKLIDIRELQEFS